MNKYYMGIDNGGTMCKAVIFSRKGEQISSASKKLEMITPRSGHTERDMDELWRVNAEVIRESIEKSGISPDDIKGVSCCGHGKGLYLWGKDNRPVRNGIVSTDTRAWKYPEEWQKDGTADKVYEKTCQTILACQPVSLLRWLKDNEADVIEKIKWIFEVKDYIRFRLTGEAYAEITDYSGSNLFNLISRSYDKDLLSLFQLEEIYQALPPIKKSAELCGYISEETAALTHLKAGTPVSGGMFDIDACSIAMDITNEENICVIAGTWSINEYISKDPVLDKSTTLNSVYCMEEYYLIEESSPTSAGNLEWYIDMFLIDEKQKAEAEGKSIYEYCNKEAASVKPEEQNIIFLPYIFGSNYNAKSKACLIGMDSHHTSAHIIRAVFEGIVFCHMVHIEKLLKSRTSTRAIRLAGGAAKSELWAQMFADVTGLPVEIIDNDELGALGCAMAAAAASGEYTDLKEAASEMTNIKLTMHPDPEKKNIYMKKYENYKKVSESLNIHWNEEV